MSNDTLADVADKTVDHIATGVKTITDAVQKVAPHAWDVAVRQQKIEATVELAIEGAAILLLVAALTFVAFKYRSWVQVARARDHAKDLRRYPNITPAAPTGNEDATAVQIPCAIGAFVVAMFLMGLVSAAATSFVQLSNPEYYAAKALLEAVK